MRIGIAVWLIMAVGVASAEQMAAETSAELSSPDLSTLEPAVQQQLREAQQALATVLASESAEDHLRVAHLAELGRLYLAYELLDAADAAFARAQSLGGNDYRLIYYRAYTAELSQRLEDAETGYRETLRQQPDFLPANMRLAQLLRRSGRLDEAEQALRTTTVRMLETVPGLAVLLAEWGELRLDQGRHEEALAQLEPVLEAFPQADRFNYPAAMALRSLGRVAEAREHLERSGKVGLRFPDELVDTLAELTRGERVQILRGQTAYRAGDYAAAVEAFQAALKANPRSVAAQVNLGSALGALGRIDEAIDRYRKALALRPDSLAARFNLAELLLTKGETEEAAGQLEAVVEAKPDDLEARARLAGALSALGRKADALVQIQVLLEQRPGSVALLREAAQLNLDLGRFDVAKAELERAVEADPADGNAVHALARLLAANPDPALRDGERALELAGQVFAARNTVEHAQTLAMALGETGRCEEAADVQQAAVDSTQREGGDSAALLERLTHYRTGPPCAPPTAKE